MIRFNEAIDQALAESIAFFSAYVERSRNLLLGILGHDMRTPLQSIKMTALLLSELNAGSDVSKAASRLINSGARMQLLLDDLLDFNRVQLDLGLTVVPVPVDLVRICRDEVEEIRAAHPERTIELQVVGDGYGCWDPSRMHQLLANLVGNAVKYGSSASPIRVSLVGEDQEVHLRIRNSGPPVEQLETMFEPLVRGSPAQHGNDKSLGLGFTSRVRLPVGTEVRSRVTPTSSVRSFRCVCRVRTSGRPGQCTKCLPPPLRSALQSLRNDASLQSTSKRAWTKLIKPPVAWSMKRRPSSLRPAHGQSRRRPASPSAGNVKRYCRQSGWRAGSVRRNVGTISRR